MRRDVVTQVVVQYPDGCETFATPLEAERFIAWNTEEAEPEAAWLEDMQGRKRWDYDIVDNGDGSVSLVSRDAIPRLDRTLD